MEQLCEMPGEASVPLNLNETLYIWQTDDDSHPATTREEYFTRKELPLFKRLFDLSIVILFIIGIITYLMFCCL
jgi:hypothetical protein